MVFQHQYITDLEVTPADTVVNALNDIKSILLKCTNTGGNEDRQAIQKLHALFRTESKGNIAFKKVTFQDLPDIPTCNTPMANVNKMVQHANTESALQGWQLQLSTNQ